MATAIPTAYKISESGHEHGTAKRFRGQMVYRIPQDEVETYRDSFTPGLDTASLTTSACINTTAGQMVGIAANMTATMVGMPVTYMSNVYTVTDYLGTYSVDTSYTGTDGAQAALTTSAVTFQGSKVWPGKTGVLAPRLHDYYLQPQYPGQGDHAKLTTYYETPSLHQLVEESTARAMIEMDVMGASERLKREHAAVGGKFIEGPAPTASTANLRWRVTKGSNVTWRPGLSQLRVKCAESTFSIEATEAKVGFVNNGILTNFGNCPKGTLMFLGAQVVSRLPEADMWLTHHYFARDSGEYSGGSTARVPWQCISEKVLDTVMKVDVVGVDGAVLAGADAETKYIATKSRPSPAVTSARVLSKGSADFSGLNTRLEWLNSL